MHDVFVSYAHADADAVSRLVEALENAGLRIWIDRTEIANFAAITRTIAEGLAQSKAFLAYYSRSYPTRTACQWELTAAFVAAHAHPDGLGRVLIVNPEESDSHILPKPLRDRKYLAAPSDAEAMRHALEAIACQLAALSGPLGAGPAPRPLQWYPARGTGSAHFVGRVEQMWELHSALHASEAPLAEGGAASDIALVTGLGGVGKSLLVEEYALRFGGFYPAGVFWLRAFGNDSAKADITAAELEATRQLQFGAVAAVLQLPASGKTPAEIQGLLRDHFQRAGAGLWVVDDFPSGLEALELRSWFAPHPMVKTVVTMRSREHESIGKLIAVGELAEADGYALLTSRVEPRSAHEESSAQSIAGDLGYHALALDVAASALTAYEGDAPFRTFLEELAHDDADSLELAAELSGSLPNGHEKSIATTLLHSIRQVSEAARDVLRLASLMAAAPIPEIILLTNLGVAGKLDERRTRQNFRLAARDLNRFSLATRQGDASGESAGWLVHTLVTRAVRFAYRNDARVEELRRTAVSLLTQWLYELWQNQQPAGPELAHARKLCRSGGGTAEINLTQFVARHDELIGAYALAVAGWRAVLAALEPQFGPEDPNILSTRNNIAIALRKNGDVTQAAVVHREVLEARQRTLGSGHPDTITSMDNLGVCLCDLGEYVEAARMHRRAIELFSAAAGRKSPSTLTAMANLAGALRQSGKKEELEEAVVLFSDLLRLRVETLGRAHPSTLRAMAGLAETLRETGRLEAACLQLESATKMLEETVGAENPLTLEAKHNLATARMNLGDLTGAQTLAEQAAAGRRKVLGERHPDTLHSLETLSLLRRGPKNLQSLRDLRRDILDDSLRRLGPDHPNTVISQTNLGVTLTQMGDTKRGRELLESALATASTRLGPKHPVTTSTAWNLYDLLENNTKESATAAKLVADYLAWLLLEEPSKLALSQREVRERFDQTRDGLFILMKARLSGDVKTEP
jgi:tetratricopeptide (TPR) repeat protein